MKAKSIKGNSPEEIKTALTSSISDGFTPTLAFVFISIKNDIDRFRMLLDQQGIQIFGATTGGEFIYGGIGAGSNAILLLDINPSQFKILLRDYSDKQPESVAREMAIKAKEEFNNPSFIISTSVHATGESESLLGDTLLKALESSTGKETIIWGGRAGDDFIFDETIVFTNHLATKRGILLLVLGGDKIQVLGEAASGQKPVGTEKIITKAIGNWVHESDQKPAAEMVLKYLGLNLTQEEAETFYPTNSTVVFSVSRDKGDPVLRGAGLFNWKDKSISVPGNIKEGDKIRLTLPPDFEVIEEVSKNAERIRQEEMPEADALLMFSGIGRLCQFGPLIGDEIEVYKRFSMYPWQAFSPMENLAERKTGTMNFITTPVAGSIKRKIKYHRKNNYMNNAIKLFEEKKVRTYWDEKEEKWYFPIIDVIEILTGTDRGRKYWNDLKAKLKKEGSELSEKIGQLKMKAEDGKQRLTDVADTEQLLRLIQSIPSSNAEPFKQWLSKVGYERMQEIANPEQSLERARENWQKLGRSENWIQQRMTGPETRNKLTDYWKESSVEKSDEFAFLTNIIHTERAGLSVKQHKNLKGLADEFLRLTYHGVRAKDKSFNATVKTDFESRLKKVNLIPQDIGRVILNLITNAFYAVNEKKKTPQPP